MANDKDKKEIERWRKIASRLSMALAVMILASGVIGSWIGFENRALDSYRSSNEDLRTVLRTIREKLASKTNGLEECLAKNEELEQDMLTLQLENASLKAMLDE